MADVDQLAREHPYTAKQNAEQCCTNIMGMFTLWVPWKPGEGRGGGSARASTEAWLDAVDGNCRM